ncbi:TRAP transporter small permease subunit [Iocasia frigidifontis]|uniref:TRAP transporter small permease subunit n=1 Tax=Iocasia fonsfrigidae TaxID=2682810 RepID=A0A8A7KNP7_9FIRM|nr:TRAP transporter small permease [Iocasia fonsfrigidae]QTL99452.1 TRAP transporter small permease subunit [Iocasia fonsfrigidae]
MKYLSKIEKFLVVTLMFLIFTVLMGHVLGRYVFNSPLFFAEELSRICFIWIVMICASVGIRSDSHTKVTYFASKLPVKCQTVLEIINHLLVIYFFCIVIYYGVNLSVRTWTIPTAAMRWSWGLIYLSAPIGGILALINSVRKIKEIIKIKLGEVV